MNVRKYVNCGVKELYESRSSKLKTQLLQLRKESLKKKKKDLHGIGTLDHCETGAALLLIELTSQLGVVH